MIQKSTIIMTRLLLLLLCAYPFLFLMAQSEEVTNQSDLIRLETISTLITLTEGKGLEFIQEPQTNNPNLIELLVIPKEDIRLKEQTDLAIRYTLKPLEKGLSYQMDFSLFDKNGQPIPFVRANSKGDYGRIEENPDRINYEFIQQDILENGVYYGQTYRLEINCQLRGLGLNCQASRPKFDWSFQKRRIYYIPAAAGLTATIIGLVNKNNYLTDYDNYLQLWENGNSKVEAQAAFDLATTKKDRNTNLAYIGAGIAVVSGLTLLTRYLKNHVPKVRTYEKYCKKRPAPKVGFNLIPAKEGIGLALQF